MTVEQRTPQAQGGKPSLQQPSASAGLMAGDSAEAALIQAPARLGAGARTLNLQGEAAQISIEIDIAVPIRKFRIRNLVAMAAGQVISSDWPESEDMPLGTYGTQLAWTEFEVVDQKLAVRITRLL